MGRGSIVLVHGFGGHPLDTWTKADADQWITIDPAGTFTEVEAAGTGGEYCWPIEPIPIETEDSDAHAHPRVLSFRYHESTVRPYRQTSLSRLSNELLHQFVRWRRDDEFRPIAWVGHSVGGMIIKNVNDSVPFSLSLSLFLFLSLGCSVV